MTPERRHLGTPSTHNQGIFICSFGNGNKSKKEEEEEEEEKEEEE